MRNGANLFRIIGAVVAIGALHPIASLATDGGELEERTRQAGEDRWVPSLAITSGVNIQKQQGFADSLLFEDGSGSPEPLQGFFKGNDIAVSPFVGGALELMTPALPIPTRPRLFVSGEILPTFASDRDLALDGDPGCVRGPEPNAPCATEPGGLSGATFDENSANGQGTSTTAEVDTLVFGAGLGVAFPFQFGKRQLRIKPSVGWINYKVKAEGLVVNAACGDPKKVPPNRCNDFLREPEALSANDSQRFNGIGPGLDVEMDTGQYGPLGVSLFMGGRAYAIVGDRKISFDATQSFDDQLGMDVAVGQFEVEVDPWMFRAHVGVRFHWLGSQK